MFRLVRLTANWYDKLYLRRAFHNGSMEDLYTKALSSDIILRLHAEAVKEYSKSGA